jgi:hypothetical protein
MKKQYFAWMVILGLLASCSANIRMTDINLESGGDMMVDASGATNRTETGQISQADLSELIKAAKAAVGKKTSRVIDTIKDVLGGDEEEDLGTAVSPTGTVEEVQ